MKRSLSGSGPDQCGPASEQPASNNKGSGYVCGHSGVSSVKADSGRHAVSGHAAPGHVSLEREKTAMEANLWIASQGLKRWRRLHHQHKSLL